jgi:hypothetical protein
MTHKNFYKVWIVTLKKNHLQSSNSNYRKFLLKFRKKENRNKINIRNLMDNMSKSTLKIKNHWNKLLKKIKKKKSKKLNLKNNHKLKSKKSNQNKNLQKNYHKRCNLINKFFIKMIKEMNMMMVKLNWNLSDKLCHINLSLKDIHMMNLPIWSNKVGRNNLQWLR